MQAQSVFLNHISPHFFLLKLKYLCDIFDKPNVLTLSLQGNNMLIFKLIENVRENLQWWTLNDECVQNCLTFVYCAF